MKKFLLLASAALALFFVSCTNNTAADGNKHTEQEQKNIAASDAISRAFETGNESIVDSVVADDFVDHTDRGDMKGKDSLKAMVKMIYSNFKDMKQEKIREVAEGDFVYTWVRYTGTSNGSMGMPPGPYDMTAMEVTRFKDGKAAEHWGFMEMQSMAKMMPQPSTQATTTTDTTKQTN